MATSIDQKDHVRTALRVPPDLHLQLHAAAQNAGRSFNAEIVARLQASFGKKNLATLGLLGTAPDPSAPKHEQNLGLGPLSAGDWMRRGPTEDLEHLRAFILQQQQQEREVIRQLIEEATQPLKSLSEKLALQQAPKLPRKR